MLKKKEGDVVGGLGGGGLKTHRCLWLEWRVGVKTHRCFKRFCFLLFLFFEPLVCFDFEVWSIQEGRPFSNKLKRY